MILLSLKKNILLLVKNKKISSKQCPKPNQLLKSFSHENQKWTSDLKEGSERNYRKWKPSLGKSDEFTLKWNKSIENEMNWNYQADRKSTNAKSEEEICNELDSIISQELEYSYSKVERVSNENRFTVETENFNI